MQCHHHLCCIEEKRTLAQLQRHYLDLIIREIFHIAHLSTLVTIYRHVTIALHRIFLWAIHRPPICFLLVWLRLKC